MTSYRSNFEELKLLIHETDNPTCLCLQETRHGDRKLNPPSGYEIIQSESRRTDDHERGVALLISKNVHYVPIQLRLTDNIEAVAAKVWLDKYYTVCSMYLSPNLTVEENDIKNVINQLQDPFLLLGDMNARHGIWGEPVQNTKGSTFYRLLLEQNLSLLNDEEKTCYSAQHNTSTLIDLSIASALAFPDFTASVIECRHGSDHHPVKIQKNPPPEVGEPSFRFKTEKADWTKFKLLTEISSDPHDMDIDQRVEYLTKFLLDAAEDSMPVSTGLANGKIPVPWWNLDCDRAHRNRKRAQRALHRNHTTANAISLRRHNAICRKTFKEAKRASWKNYVTSLNADTNLNEIWKKVNKIRGKFTRHPAPLLAKEDGNLTNKPAETSEILADAYQKISSNTSYSKEFNKFRKIEETKPINFKENKDETYQYNKPFSMKELTQALATVKESSPGEDNVPYSMIKNSHLTFQKQLLDLYNKIYAEQIFPVNWKIALIIPIPKPGKDHSIPQNFRPISLTSCLCKLLEKMINTRLVWYLERENLLSKTQSGFKKNRSTTDSIAQVTCDLQRAITKKKHTIAIFFDLQGAYDTAWKRGILNKLHSFGLRGKLPIFVENFLTNRQIKVKIGTIRSNSRTLDQGIPQGSVLSCTLFAIAIDAVTSRLPPQVGLTLYVDDLTVYACGSTNTAERQIKTTLRRLDEWCNETGFHFSASKCVAVHVCRVRQCPKAVTSLEINKAPITIKPTKLFLGIIIDDSLRFHKHIEHTRTECMRKLNLLKFLSNTSWGADSQTLLKLYTALIKPKLEYGAEAYGSASVSALEKLNPIQNNAMRIATGAFKSTPIASLQALTGIKSLSSSRNEKLANYVVRVLTNPQNPMSRIITEDVMEEDRVDSSSTLFNQRSLVERAKSVWNIYKLDATKLWLEEVTEHAPWMLSNLDVCGDIIKNAKRDIPENRLKNLFTCHLQSHMENQLLIYTDGSKTNTGVAFSVAGYQQGGIIRTEARKIPPEASIFTAELYAILLAVRKGAKTTYNYVTIVSDSKSSIQAINQIPSKNPIVNLIQEKIYQSEKNFNLCWVPSHVGIPGNELADRAAQEATKRNASINVPVLRCDIKSQIKRESAAKWKEEWQMIPESSNKLREITDSPFHFAHSTCTDRRWERALSRLRLGHSRITHGYLMSGGSPPMCDHCDEETRLSIKHILVECPAYREKRRQFLGTSNVTMKSLLNKGDTSSGGAIERFVRAIDLIHML